MDWKYLDTEPFRTRQVLAAHFVRDCENILEVGSHKNPISGFLRGPHKHVVCADPRTEDPQFTLKYKRDGRLIASELNLYRGSARDALVGSGDWGFVCLGYDPIDLPLEFFLSSIETSSVAVLEAWESYTPWKVLKQNLPQTGKSVFVRMKLDLYGNDLGDMTGSWPPRYNRELLVLK